MALRAIVGRLCETAIQLTASGTDALQFGIHIASIMGQPPLPHDD
jgi:hypothetical protein